MSRKYNEYREFERRQDEEMGNEQKENDSEVLHQCWFEDLGRLENPEILINCS